MQCLPDYSSFCSSLLFIFLLLPHPVIPNVSVALLPCLLRYLFKKAILSFLVIRNFWENLYISQSSTVEIPEKKRYKCSSVIYGICFFFLIFSYGSQSKELKTITYFHLPMTLSVDCPYPNLRKQNNVTFYLAAAS